MTQKIQSIAQGVADIRDFNILIMKNKKIKDEHLLLMNKSLNNTILEIEKVEDRLKNFKNIYTMEE